MIDTKHDEIWGLVIGNVVCLEGITNQKWGRTIEILFLFNHEVDLGHKNHLKF